ncbi:hypothetical protein ERO13_A09G076160v2 [Gossypium hirsutum]|uniref:Uncharacterized protein n=5 Tax=Gossypium TaxID=3633 RepID=A0A2P5Y2I3_GOSBA|nr:hypothetical protein ES319_A09G079900v1 [Gossypium barbadense]KAG4182917.1 hypothetical protein ERO13_A09G076160v2 [Gossypium hirsutum]KAK5803338.1 hypothetical protein PVK06_030983 [Gossypium arboreum]TYH01914.1 hypothetical protein ES288_A09G098400v1 [Gossypium darwinii]TYI09727.1 hypothetical protein ES332_A09G093800v1 [Gossypium tomentosum]TYJ17868.1 hypothetical protein E1A91_A09G083500v1 [Gossypium mustelinum]
MVVESMVSTPYRRSVPMRKQPQEFGSFSTLVQRHRFLLTTFGFLTILCTIYLYFAVTLVASDTCSGLKGTQRPTCQHRHATSIMYNGKLKFL